MQLCVTNSTHWSGVTRSMNFKLFRRTVHFHKDKRVLTSFSRGLLMYGVSTLGNLMLSGAAAGRHTVCFFSIFPSPTRDRCAAHECNSIA